MGGIILGAILGGALVYFWDPDRGRDRRTDARHRVTATGQQVSSGVSSASQQVSQQVSTAGQQVSDTSNRVRGQALRLLHRSDEAAEDSGEQEALAASGEAASAELNPASGQEAAADASGAATSSTSPSSATGASPATFPAANATGTNDFTRPTSVTSE
jgi:gas vesicle protein